MIGSCLCGGVQFEVDAPLRPVIVCHCTQCRKASGHVWAASSVPKAAFRLINEGALRWYRSSDVAERGFCADCGSSLFWHPFGQGTMHFAPGALDGPTGLQIAEEWHLEDAGDYYTRPAAAKVVTRVLPVRGKSVRGRWPDRRRLGLPLQPVPQNVGAFRGVVRCRGRWA